MNEALPTLGQIAQIIPLQSEVRVDTTSGEVLYPRGIEADQLCSDLDNKKYGKFNKDWRVSYMDAYVNAYARSVFLLTVKPPIEAQEELAGE